MRAALASHLISTARHAGLVARAGPDEREALEVIRFKVSLGD